MSSSIRLTVCFGTTWDQTPSLCIRYVFFSLDDARHTIINTHYVGDAFILRPRHTQGIEAHERMDWAYVQVRPVYRETLTAIYMNTRWVKADGSWVYVKLYAETMQGVRPF